MQTSYAFDSFALGPLIVDATKVYAAAAAIAGRGGAVRVLPLRADSARRSAPAPTTTPARWWSGSTCKRLYALTFGLGAACVGAAGAMLVLIVDVTPPLGPAYTLLAFVIVIIGGLGSMPGALLGGVLIGVTEALAGPVLHAVGEEHVRLRHPGAGAAVPAAGHHGQERVMIARLIEGVPRRGARAARLRCWSRSGRAPCFANDYLLTVLILILYFAYIGQAWNIMMGFAGQLSLGHALYVGLGAYTAAALYVHFGIGPWLGLPVAIADRGRVPARSSASWRSASASPASISRS